MAKKKKEEVAEEATKDNVIKVDLSEKQNQQEDNVVKVNLDKPPVKKDETKEEAVENNTDNEVVVELTEDTTAAPEQKEVQPEAEAQDQPVVEEITEEQVEDLAEQAEEAITKSMETGKALPENIQKLVDFMEDTGGSLEDYVKLNRDYSDLDNLSLLKEYYKQTKPHLDSEEIEFMMEDKFSFDADLDEDIEIKRKKLALKEQVAEAKRHLDGAKSKYYEEIKAGSKLTKEQQKAIDFFNRYNKESKEQEEVVEKQTRTFLNKTNQLFNKNFKGFEYNVGEKRFRFNVKDAGDVKETQSDINNFIGKFLNKNNEIEDAAGYHKGLFTAMNPDAIAKHFYEQGKADALKDSIAKSKNVSMDPRQEFNGQINAGGIKVKVLGNNSNDFKFKIKNKN
jgi:predicted PolB exonuclease-like 3'-5' exonuclease